MEPNELGLLLPEPAARDSKYSRGTMTPGKVASAVSQAISRRFSR